MAKLTDKQQRFSEEYLIDLNATRAYKAVYGINSDNIAAVNASKLLRNAKVQEYLSKRKESLSNKLQITQEMVLEGYRKLAFYDARKFYDKDGNLKKITDLDEESAFALAGFEVMEEKDFVKGCNIVVGLTKKIKMSDRKSALDSICRVLGFNAATKTEVTGKDGKEINPTPIVFLSADTLTDDQIEKYLHQNAAGTDDESI